MSKLDRQKEAIFEAGMRGQMSRREMLRNLLILGVSAPAALALIEACGGSTTTSSSSPGAKRFEGQTLVVTSYGGVWHDFLMKNTVQPFMDLTGATVQLADALSAEMASKLRAAGKDNPPYDVVVFNEVVAQQIRKEGFFVPLTTAKVPNLKDVYPNLRIAGDLGVMGLISPIGLVYRSDKVTPAPTSWLDMSKYGGRVGILAIANSVERQMILKFSKILSNDYQNWTTGFDWIKRNLCAAKQFDLNFFTAITQGEVWIGPMGSADFATLSGQGVPLGFTPTSEGFLGKFEQVMNVTSGSQVKDLAFAFIDYWLGIEQQTIWAALNHWAPANSKVKLAPDVAKLIPVTAQTVSTLPVYDYAWLTGAPLTEMTSRWTREMKGSC
jgi:putative spermidine/putrescine transport system substrate-binding protein